ncbi:hypothetical protein HMPREF9630_00586 [Peptoanaerobacter stomatis]|uniref:Uncharacterized protein n=1 Tax=Peptoanaerobacter stomatis TaxID=796937 RepID=V9HVC3_9FIRM|nr:hypothetical protein [Peptoanaerobacter stomatis]EHL17419.1 hypothetical protein HMPREF9630_00586 [Peptoanaerobacter stomatis]
MKTTEVWLAYFEKHAKLREDSIDTHLDDKEDYLIYLSIRGIEARAVVRADEKSIALLKEKIKEVIGVKKINSKELDAINVLGLQIYEI